VDAPVTPRQERAASSGANEFKPGQKVQHATFGVGIVLSAKEEGDDIQVAVAFPNVGMKKLMQSFAKLKKV
jgi:DNA helicase-2/ATP-dependent DNA helicase PcrA